MENDSEYMDIGYIDRDKSYETIAKISELITQANDEACGEAVRDCVKGAWVEFHPEGDIELCISGNIKRISFDEIMEDSKDYIMTWDKDECEEFISKLQEIISFVKKENIEHHGTSKE